MDRLMGWIEARSSAIEGDERGGRKQQKHHDQQQAHYRPPPLRTSSTYDDDDAFNAAALHLLSRYEALGLTETEAITSILVCPKDRASFFESLCIRRTKSMQLMTPSTAALIRSVDKTFGRTLKAMVDEEGVDGIPRCHSIAGHGDSSSGGFATSRASSGDHPPTTPRHIAGPNSSGSTSHGGNNNSTNNITTGRRKKNRRFFPESDSYSGGFFRSKRVQNVDWKLTQTIENVQSLRLDGTESFPVVSSNSEYGYQPPSMR